MTAYGYIRKSVVHDLERTLSPATQEQAIRSLAARHGDADVVILSDLDVSGKKDRTRRRGWDQFLRAVESGEATAVYAYSLSRFARSVSQLAAFFDLCERLHVPVRVDRDHIDTSSATGKLVGNVLASLAQFESDVASERVKDAFAAKRRSDPTWTGPGNLKYGMLPGEDAVEVVRAFREAGSFEAAARLLYERGVPCRGKRNVWHGTTVAEIVRRVAPDEVGPATGRGVTAGPHHFRLSRLLVCGQCGTRMTPSMDKRNDLVRYYCREARTTPHGRGWITDNRLLPLIKAEADSAALLIKRLTVGTPEDEATMATLSAKRARIVDMYAEGVIEKDDRDRRLADIADQESKLTTRRAIKRITMPPDIEAGSPAKVNAYLRQLFERIVIEDMKRPTRRGPSQDVPTLTFEWRDESLRSDVDEAA